MPLLTTSFAFIFDCAPLRLASGSCAAARSTMGAGVVYGMTTATAMGLIIILVCHAFVQQLVERSGRKKPVEITTPPAAPAAEKTGAHR